MSRPHAVVIGAGIIGMAVAERLAGDGWSVEIVDASPRRPQASEAAAGMLAPLAEVPVPGAFFEACRESRDLWREWAALLEERSGLDIDYDTRGALLPVFSADAEFAESLAASASALGEASEWLDAAALHERLPGLAPSSRRGLLLPGEHRVDNRLVLDALEVILDTLGIPIRRTRPVERIETDPLRVHAGGECLGGDLVVVAAGAWSGDLELSPRLPVRPVRGQMIAYDDFRLPWSGSVRGRDSYAVIRRRDGLVVGATVEEAGFELGTTAEGRERLEGFARRLFPELATFPAPRIWSGLRPAATDERPLVGQLGDGPVIAATGHYRNGILLAPWTAQRVSRLVAGQALDDGFTPRLRS